MRFQVALSKTLCFTPPPLIHRWFKYCQGSNINKTMLSASPSFVFYTKFTISVLKSKYVFHPNGNGTRTTSVRLGLKILCLLPPTNSEKNKQISWKGNQKLATQRVQSCTHNHNTYGESLKVLYTYSWSLGTSNCTSVIKSHPHHSE